MHSSSITFYIVLVASALVVAAAGSADHGLDLSGMAVRRRHHSQLEQRSPYLDTDAHNASDMARRSAPSKRCGASRKAQSKVAAQASSGDDGKEHSDKHSGNGHQNSNKQNEGSGSNKKSEGSKKVGHLGAQRFVGSCPSARVSDNSPNGHIEFLNCGIQGGGWEPPHVTMDELSFVSAGEALQSRAFQACKPYRSMFETAASRTGVPPVLLMSFAMQESSCNPSVTGGNGEIGMMQLTPEKCTNANCYDVETNIEIAAKYFEGQLKQYGGNALQALGSYNGWQEGMTFAKATSQQYGCRAQNNLDYLNQLLNGWCQGKDGSQMKVFNNLGACY